MQLAQRRHRRHRVQHVAHRPDPHNQHSQEIRASSSRTTPASSTKLRFQLRHDRTGPTSRSRSTIAGESFTDPSPWSETPSRCIASPLATIRSISPSYTRDGPRTPSSSPPRSLPPSASPKIPPAAQSHKTPSPCGPAAQLRRRSRKHQPSAARSRSPHPRRINPRTRASTRSHSSSRSTTTSARRKRPSPPRRFPAGSSTSSNLPPSPAPHPPPAPTADAETHHPADARSASCVSRCPLPPPRPPRTAPPPPTPEPAHAAQSVPAHPQTAAPHPSAAGSTRSTPRPSRPYPRDSTSTLHPRSRSNSASAITTGVFPAPPADKLPTLTTGHFSFFAFNTPSRPQPILHRQPRRIQRHQRPCPFPPRTHRFTSPTKASTARPVAPSAPQTPPPPLTHRLRRRTVVQQLDQCGLQPDLVAHNPNPICRVHLRHNVPEVLVRWPHHHRHPKLRWLQWIMPTPRHQAPTHKRNIRQSVNGREVPNRIQHTASVPSATCGHLPRPKCCIAATSQSELRTSLDNLVETFVDASARATSTASGPSARMAGHASQQRLSLRPPAYFPRPPIWPPPATRGYMLRHRDSPPEPARHTSNSQSPAPVRPSPHRHQPPRILLTLRQKQIHPPQHLPPNRPHPHPARKRPIRNPRIHHRHRHPGPSALHQHPRPTRSPSAPASSAAAPADTPAPPRQNPADSRKPSPPQTAPVLTPARSPSS